MAACFALGAIVSPPDAVSARAVLKGVHLPPRLEALREGESLLNDADRAHPVPLCRRGDLSGVFHSGEAIQSFVTVARFVWIFASDAILEIARKAGLKRAHPLGWR